MLEDWIVYTREHDPHSYIIIQRYMGVIKLTISDCDEPSFLHVYIQQNVHVLIEDLKVIVSI